MSNGSSNKKVAKAASAGGGSLARRARSSSSSYNATIIGVCIVGIALIVGSVIGRSVLETSPYVASSKKVKEAAAELKKLQEAKKPDTKKIEAAATKYNELNSQTHIHSAYGIWNCDKYVDPFDGSALPDPLGIHAHEDGLLHVHPFSKRAAGKKARMKLFFNATKMSMSTEKLEWIASPDGSKKNTLNVDKDKCKGKKAEIYMLYWEKALGKDVTKTAQKYTDGFGDIKLNGGGAYAFVFAAKGTKISEIPLPPSVKTLPTPSDLEAPDTTSETTTGSTIVVPTTVAGSPTTVAGSATTVAGSPTTVAGSPTTVASNAPTTAPSVASTTAVATTAVPTTTKK